MNLKLCGALLGASVVLWTTVATFAGSVKDHRIAAWQAEYRRPSTIPFPDDDPDLDRQGRARPDAVLRPPVLGVGFAFLRELPQSRLVLGRWPGASGRDGHTSMALRAPTLLNVAWTLRLGWDGKFRDLEAVSFAAITGAGNMNLPETEAVGRVAANPGYARAFSETFEGGGVTRRNIELALATYERTIVLGEAPSIVGWEATRGRSARTPSAASRCSTVGPAARPATVAGHSPTAPSMTSGRRGAATSARGRLSPLR